MTTAARIGNWTRQIVQIGGTGNITLAALEGFPTFAESIGIGTDFYYTILNANQSPLEHGRGVLSDGITLVRETVLETYVDATYDTSEPDPADVPVDAIVICSPTRQGLEEFVRREGIVDLGDVSGTVIIDLDHKNYRFNCTGNVIIQFSNEPPAGCKQVTTFEITRTTGSGAQVTAWPPSVAFNSYSIPLLVDNRTTTCSVTTSNGGGSYIGYANGSVYELEATGLATTWNPSATFGAGTTLADSNVRAQGVQGGTGVTHTFGGVKAFASKSSGKHRAVAQFVTRNWGLVGNTTGGHFNMQFGLTDEARLANYTHCFLAGDIDTSGGENHVRQVRIADSSVLGNAVFPGDGAGNGDVVGICVDFDAGKLWFTYNGTVLDGGDPEAGTGGYDIPTGVEYFIYMSRVKTAAMGTWASPDVKLLNELEDSFGYSLWPSFQNWRG